MDDFDHLKNLRLAELALVQKHISPGDRVLEIGAGAGWQARRISEMGVDIEAIDLDPESSQYVAERVWPVQKYDGRRIPFPDGHFRIVFSSNVLEHIRHIEEFQAEILRVLEKGGMAIHLMPTGSWRLWTNVTRLFVPVKWGIRRLTHKETTSAETEKPASAQQRPSGLSQSLARNSLGSLLRKAVVPPPHGEFGNGISELYYFSRYRWQALFERTGWKLEAQRSNRLIYTGYSLFGRRLSIRNRRRLSYLLGGACRVYVLTPAPQ